MRARTVRSSSRYGSRASPTLRAQLRRRRFERQLVAQRVDLLAGTGPRRPIATAGTRVAVTCGVTLRVAVAIAADPGAEANRRGVDRQAAARARAQRAVDAAHVARQRVPQALLEDDAGRCALRRAAWGAAGARRSSAQAVTISRRSAATSSSCSGAVRSGRSRIASAAAMRLYFWTSVRRATSVGCAVSTSSIRSAQTASCSRSGVMPPASSRPKPSSHDPRCGGAGGSR